MGHEWKIGDWAELNGTRYLVYHVGETLTHGVMKESGSASWLLDDSSVRHLPECTGWDWKPTELPELLPGWRHLERNEIVAKGDLCFDTPGITGHPVWRLAGGKSIGSTAGHRMDHYGIAAFARKIEPEPVAHEWKFGDWAHSPLGIIRFIAYHGDMWFLCADGLVRPLEGKNAIYLPGCTGFDWTPEDPKKQIEPRYRPFANAAEFAQLGYKWVMNWSGDNPSYRKMITEFDDDGVWEGEDCISWDDMARRYRFEDGTPFGVLENSQ